MYATIALRTRMATAPMIPPFVDEDGHVSVVTRRPAGE